MKVFILALLALSVSIDQTQVTAFATSSKKTASSLPTGSRIQTTTVPAGATRMTATKKEEEHGKAPEDKNTEEILRLRGGGEAAAPAAAPKKKIRIPALDGVRFLLATHIVLGHFLRFANPSEFWLKFFSQVSAHADWLLR